MIIPRMGDELASTTKLPVIGASRRGRTAVKGGWGPKSYKDFAWRAKRLNPDTVFTKDVMRHFGRRFSGCFPVR